MTIPTIGKRRVWTPTHNVYGMDPRTTYAKSMSQLSLTCDVHCDDVHLPAVLPQLGG